MSFWNGYRWVDERTASRSPASIPARRRSVRDWLATIPILLLVPALISSMVPVDAGSGPLAAAGAPVAAVRSPVISRNVARSGWVPPTWSGWVGGVPTVTGTGAQTVPVAGAGATSRTSSTGIAPVASGSVASTPPPPAALPALAAPSSPVASSTPAATATPASTLQPAPPSAPVPAATPIPTPGMTLTPTPASTPGASPTPTATPTPTLAPVSGRTFYLSPDGSDTASGSITAPRKTLLAGSSLLGPGDTLLLRGGTYHDPGNYNWAPTASGTATAPITAKAYPGEIPVFDGGASVPATGWNSHPQIALILKNVSWVTIEDLTFVHFDPWMDGILQTMGSSHITFRRIKGHDQYTTGRQEHYFYISAHSSYILIEDSTLDGISGWAVHIYDGDYVTGSNAVGSSNITVRNSRLTNNGWGGIVAGSGLSGGLFTNNLITSPTGTGIEFNTPSNGVAVSQNTIRSAIGIATILTGGGYGPAVEENDCIDSPAPFLVNWPQIVWSLAQWQATGRGAGTTLGACP